MKTTFRSILVGLALLPVIVFAQFNPGSEAKAISVGGGKTMLEQPIQMIAPGKAKFVVTGINAVYLNGVPSDVKANFSADDASGKGKAFIVDVASNPALANQQLCWRGVGSDWGNMSCGAISNGRAEVVVDVGMARNTSFALVPIIADGSKKQLAWAAHPENTRVQLRCPRMTNTDTASVFTSDASGTISVAKEGAVATYEKHYGTFCQR